MCTGLELALIGGLSMGGGSYLQNRSMEKKQDAADKHALAGLIRQDLYDKQRGSIYQEALQSAGDNISEEALAEKAQTLTEDLRSNIRPQDMDYGTGDAGDAGPRVVQDVFDKEQAKGNAYLDLLSDAQGRLGAWGDQMWAFGDDMTGFAWDNDRILTDAGIDGQLTQAQAQHAYDTTGNKTALAGNLATQLGGMMMTQGLFNAGLASAGNPGASVLDSAGKFKPGVGVPMATPSYNPYMTLNPVV